MYIRTDEGLGKAPTPPAPGGSSVACEGTSELVASLLWRTPSPRGIAQIGDTLVVAHRETGALHQFDLATKTVRRIWNGPGDDFGPFVGPTYIPGRKELIVSALGRKDWKDTAIRPERSSPYAWTALIAS